MAVVFCLDDGDGEIRLVVENVVGAFGLLAGDEVAPDDDSPFGKPDLLAKLRQLIPSSPLHRRRDELGADVALAKRFLIEFRHKESSSNVECFRRSLPTHLFRLFFVSLPDF